MPAVQTALVIGSGIAGPVAATALAMAGIDAALYEARVSDPASANGIGGSLASSFRPSRPRRACASSSVRPR